MTIEVTSLASFRRFLGSPGATVQLIRHDWADTKIAGNTRAATLNARPGLWDAKTVKKLQTNAVQFSTGAWLDWRSGASRFRFDGDKVTVALLDDFSECMIYQLAIAAAANAA